MNLSEKIATPSLGVNPLTKQRSLQALILSGKSWFVVAFIGQIFFTVYIIGLYGVSAVQGDFTRWNTVMPHGYVDGDLTGNLSIMVHLLLAALVNIGGPLQIIPQVRRRWPRFHRWTGRAYIIAGFLISLSGIYLVWVRGSVGVMADHISITINALLIMAFAALTIRFARKRQLTQHRKWALRLFMVMSGVWFFRLGVMLWLLIHQAPVGFDPNTFTGPFLTAMNFAQYLLPLAILQLFFWAKEKGSLPGRYVATAVIAIATLATAVGIFAVTMGMWLPRI